MSDTAARPRCWRAWLGAGLVAPVLACGGALVTSANDAALREIRCIAVMPFVNATPSDKAGQMVAEMIAGRLAVAERFDVLGPTEVRPLLAARGPWRGDSLAQAYGGAWGVDAVLTGRVVQSAATSDDAGSVEVRSALLDAHTGQPVWEADTGGKVEHAPWGDPGFVAATDRVVDRLLTHLVRGAPGGLRRDDPCGAALALRGAGPSAARVASLTLDPKAGAPTPPQTPPPAKALPPGAPGPPEAPGSPLLPFPPLPAEDLLAAAWLPQLPSLSKPPPAPARGGFTSEPALPVPAPPDVAGPSEEPWGGLSSAAPAAAPPAGGMQAQPGLLGGSEPPRAPSAPVAVPEYVPALPETAPDVRLPKARRNLLRQVYSGTPVIRRPLVGANAQVKPRALRKMVDDLAALLRAVPGLEIAIDVHVDSSGSESRSKEIARKRAEAILALIARRHGFAKKRVYLRAVGNSEPISKDVTKRGRLQNTRVELRRVESLEPRGPGK